MHYIGKTQQYLKSRMMGHQQELAALILIRDYWKDSTRIVDLFVFETIHQV